MRLFILYLSSSLDIVGAWGSKQLSSSSCQEHLHGEVISPDLHKRQSWWRDHSLRVKLELGLGLGVHTPVFASMKRDDFISHALGLMTRGQYIKNAWQLLARQEGSITLRGIVSNCTLGDWSPDPSHHCLVMGAPASSMCAIEMSICYSFLMAVNVLGAFNLQ